MSHPLVFLNLQEQYSRIDVLKGTLPFRAACRERDSELSELLLRSNGFGSTPFDDREATLRRTLRAVLPGRGGLPRDLAARRPCVLKLQGRIIRSAVWEERFRARDGFR